MARVGTLEWAEETGGQLRLHDRLNLLIVQAGPTQVAATIETALLRLGLRKPIDLAGIHCPIADLVQSLKPKTSIAVAAENLCKEISDPWLLAHCYRTFAYGVLLGYTLSFDREMFFVAAMLHDVGLTTAYEQGADQDFPSGYSKENAPCFAVRGAGVARSLASVHEWPVACRDSLAEAISMHLNLRVKRSRGVEAHLLNLASAFDVAGFRFRRLPPEAVWEVEEQWLRGDNFRDDAWKAWACEAVIHPKCRGEFLNRWARFRRRINRSRLSQYAQSAESS